MTAALSPAPTLTTTTPATSPVTRWAIDTSHSEVGFRVRHMMVSWTKGKFDQFEGTLELDGQDVTRSRVEVSIDAASINTNAPDRDAHLKSPDFLDAASHPKLRFVSRSVESFGPGGLRVTGLLEVRGTQRPVVLEVDPLSEAVKDPWGNVRRGTRATARVDRKDFGLTWNAALELGGVLVGDEVHITLEVELLQK